MADGSMENANMRLTRLTFGAAALLLMSGGAYAADAQGLKPCTPAQQAARGNASGAPPNSQQAARGNASGAAADAQQAARGNASGAPPDLQQAARGNASGAPPDSQQAARGNASGAPPECSRRHAAMPAAHRRSSQQAAAAVECE